MDPVACRCFYFFCLIALDSWHSEFQFCLIALDSWHSEFQGFFPFVGNASRGRFARDWLKMRRPYFTKGKCLGRSRPCGYTGCHFYFGRLSKALVVQIYLDVYSLKNAFGPLFCPLSRESFKKSRMFSLEKKKHPDIIVRQSKICEVKRIRVSSCHVSTWPRKNASGSIFQFKRVNKQLAPCQMGFSQKSNCTDKN